VIGGDDVNLHHTRLLLPPPRRLCLLRFVCGLICPQDYLKVMDEFFYQVFGDLEGGGLGTVNNRLYRLRDDQHFFSRLRSRNDLILSLQLCIALLRSCLLLAKLSAVFFCDHRSTGAVHARKRKGNSGRKRSCWLELLFHTHSSYK